MHLLGRLPGCRHPWFRAYVAGALTVAQIVLAFFVRGPSLAGAQWAGWVCLWTAGIFGTLPIWTFRKKAGVAEGKSYIETTVLVDTGIYSIVRHPQQGTSWLLINLGIFLVAWHWTSAILGFTSMGLVYAGISELDQEGLRKFGDAYVRYMDRVPRVNFIAGIARLLSRSTRKPAGNNPREM